MTMTTGFGVDANQRFSPHSTFTTDPGRELLSGHTQNENDSKIELFSAELLAEISNIIKILASKFKFGNLYIVSHFQENSQLNLVKEYDKFKVEVISTSAVYSEFIASRQMLEDLNRLQNNLKERHSAILLSVKDSNLVYLRRKRIEKTLNENVNFRGIKLDTDLSVVGAGRIYPKTRIYISLHDLIHLAKRRLGDDKIDLLIFKNIDSSILFFLLNCLKHFYYSENLNFNPDDNPFLPIGSKKAGNLVQGKSGQEVTEDTQGNVIKHPKLNSDYKLVDFYTGIDTRYLPEVKGYEMLKKVIKYVRHGARITAEGVLEMGRVPGSNLAQLLVLPKKEKVKLLGNVLNSYYPDLFDKMCFTALKMVIEAEESLMRYSDNNYQLKSIAKFEQDPDRQNNLRSMQAEKYSKVISSLPVIWKTIFNESSDSEIQNLKKPIIVIINGDTENPFKYPSLFQALGVWERICLIDIETLKKINNINESSLLNLIKCINHYKSNLESPIVYSFRNKGFVDQNLNIENQIEILSQILGSSIVSGEDANLINERLIEYMKKISNPNELNLISVKDVPSKYELDLILRIVSSQLKDIYNENVISEPGSQISFKEYYLDNILSYLVMCIEGFLAIKNIQVGLGSNDVKPSNVVFDFEKAIKNIQIRLSDGKTVLTEEVLRECIENYISLIDTGSAGYSLRKEAEARCARIESGIQESYINEIKCRIETKKDGVYVYLDGLTNQYLKLRKEFNNLGTSLKDINDVPWNAQLNEREMQIRFWNVLFLAAYGAGCGLLNLGDYATLIESGNYDIEKIHKLIGLSLWEIGERSGLVYHVTNRSGYTANLNTIETIAKFI